jgi:hypothetical protein
MGNRSLISAALFALAALVALPACATEESDPDDSAALVSRPDDLAQPQRTTDPGGSQSGPSCDDFDTWCGTARPCDADHVCKLDTTHCGANFFGTYPNCGVTATCYPTCQPKDK